MAAAPPGLATNCICLPHLLESSAWLYNKYKGLSCKLPLSSNRLSHMSVLSRALEIISAHPLHALATAILVGIFLTVRKSAGRFRNGLPLPPGPKGWPVIGNLFDMPREKPWVVYHEWSKIYGEYCHFSLYPPMLIIFYAR